MSDAMQWNPFVFEHPSVLVSTLIGFALLAWLFVRFGVPALRAMLSERARRIEDNHDQVERALKDAADLRNDYAQRINRIEVEANAKSAQAVQDAESARALILAEAQEAAAQLERRSQGENAREQNRTRIRLRRQVVQAALAAAEHSVKDQAGDTLQHELISDFIDRTAAPAVSGGGA